MVCHVVVDGEVIIVLCSETGLPVLAESERWQSDGIFVAAVEGFSQLYLIHAWFRGHLLPCAFVLLTCKKEVVY